MGRQVRSNITALSIDELLSNRMVDAIQLMENEIGKEPDSFWIERTIDEKDDFPPNSWQKCVQILESAGFRLARETNKHKKFRSQTMASGIGATSVSVGGGNTSVGVGGGAYSGGKDFSTV